MTKQMIEVDVPDGWEAVGYRAPEIGESYLLFDGSVSTVDGVFIYPVPILRRSWKWPPWLKAGWIAMDRNGHWYAYTHEPTPLDIAWSSAGGATWLSSGALAFTPPPCDDWTKSLRENPNWKGT